MGNVDAIDGFYVSKPWTLMGSRLGDPLGFQWIADEIAEKLVPGLSSRQWDARWLTLLCKGLELINPKNVEDDERYRRISLWERGILIAAVEHGDNGRQLPGKRKAPHSWPTRYRYYGPYGTYRSLLINLGLTEPDGWVLTLTGKKLANCMNLEFNPIRGNNINPINVFAHKPYRTWLPTILGLQGLKKNEANILCPLFFGGNNNTRMNTLGNLQNFQKEYYVDSLFERFTSRCFASLIKMIRSAGNPGDTITISETFPDDLLNMITEKKLDERWSSLVKLARDIQKNGMQALVEHHVNLQGAGKRWIGKSNNEFIALVNNNSHLRSSYNFRLWNLWRFGRQLRPDITPEIYPLAPVLDFNNEDENDV